MLAFSPLSKMLVGAAVLASIFLWGFIRGASGVQDKWDLERASQQLQVVTLEKEAVSSTLKVVTVYVEKEKAAQKADQEILDDIDSRLSDTAPDSYAPLAFVGVWNAANSGVPVPGAPQYVDGEAVGIGWKEVAAQHADESIYCRSIERQLIGLQDWVREMQTVYGRK